MSNSRSRPQTGRSTDTPPAFQLSRAKKAGVYKGRGKTLNATQAAALIRRAGAGEAKAVLGREFGISRQTVYQYLQPDHR